MTRKLRLEKDEAPRILLAGKPDYERCDNKISTSKYSLATFIPAVRRDNTFYLDIVPKATCGFVDDDGHRHNPTILLKEGTRSRSSK